MHGYVKILQPHLFCRRTVSGRLPRSVGRSTTYLLSVSSEKKCCTLGQVLSILVELAKGQRHPGWLASIFYWHRARTEGFSFVAKA